MNRRALSDSERHDWLRLSRCENVGPITFRQLLRRFGSASAALNALPEIAARGGKRSFKIPAALRSKTKSREPRSWAQKSSRNAKPDYPEALAAIEDAPPLITALGQ